MTVVDVRETLAMIEDARLDPELQEVIKANLYLRVLEFTAKGSGDDARLCKETLKAENIPIHRGINA